MEEKKNKPFSHPRWNEIPVVEVISKEPRELTKEEKNTLAELEKFADEELKKIKKKYYFVGSV